MGPEGVEHKLAAILSADVVGYSRLMAQDEDATVRILSAYREQVGTLVREHRGRVVDFTGDNLLSEFPTATDAASCAVEIQRVLAARSADLPANRKLEFRIGIHLGEIRVEGQRIYGDGVNIASRLEGLAEPGGICVSGAVRDQLRRRSPLEFQNLGPQQLKNIPDPVEVYRARWAEPSRPAARTAGGGQTDPSVAVLPFVNMSSDPDQDYFADGMAEELINALTKVEGLRVMSRTSAFSFKGSNADIAAIGQKLNVMAIVEGSVRKAGERVRIAAQLIDVAGGHHLWSEVYNRPLEDVFQIQDEIARTIVQTITPKLVGDSPPELVARATESQQAYELYLRAGDRISRSDRWDTRTAIEMLKDATSIDPGYADAWARLAGACCQMEIMFDPQVRWYEQAELALETAFELNPDSAEAHTAHGRILWSPRKGFDNHAALAALAKALLLRPGSHEALMWQSVILYHVGLLDAAREGLVAALSAQPDDPLLLACLGQASWFQGRYDEAEEHVNRSIASDSTLIFNHLIPPAIWTYLGQLERAEQSLQAARQLLGDDPLLDANEGLLWAKRGEADRARAALARALQDRPSMVHVHHIHHHAAAAFAMLGETEDAIERLRVASRCGLPNFPLFRDDPHFATLREEPEMKTLMSELEREHSAFLAEFGRE